MKNELKSRIDEQFSQLEWTRQHSCCVWDTIRCRHEPITRKRLTACIAMLLALMMSIGAVAGVRYSKRYDAQKLAEETLESCFGITDEMFAFFSRETEEAEGATILRYSGIDVAAELLGTYTVRIENGTACAEWNLQGVPYAWGTDKLQTLVEICKQEGGYAQAAEEARQAKLAAGLPELQQSDAAHEAIKASTENQELEAANAKSLAKLEWSEIDRMARAAIQERYELNDLQTAALELVEESSWWKMKGKTPIVEPYYWLCQSEGEWTAGDGIYIVEMNALNGVIESVIYDSGIAGNG